MKLRLQCSLAPSCDLQHTTRDQKAKKVTAWLFMGQGECWMFRCRLGSQDGVQSDKCSFQELDKDSFPSICGLYFFRYVQSKYGFEQRCMQGIVQHTALNVPTPPSALLISSATKPLFSYYSEEKKC